MLDRYSEDAAKNMIEAYLPNPEIRKRCLDALADSIVFAHQCNGGAWGITLLNHCVRLNVGKIEVFVVGHRENGVYFVINEDFLEDEELRILRNGYSLGGPYKSVPSSRGVDVRADAIDEDRSLLWDSHLKLLEDAARAVKTRTSFYKAHSPGVLSYLRTFLDRDIPDPSYARELQILDEHDEESEREEKECPLTNLNTILFGPPGTGKTYSVQRRAVEVVEPFAKDLPPEEIGEKFRKYREEGRIEFVTFHPSFSYEEFVEGFRYDPEKKVPTLHDGVFKEICKRALNPHQRKEVREGARVWKVSLGRADQPQVFERCVKNGEIAIGWFGENLSDYDKDGIARLFKEEYGVERHTNSINSVDYFVNEMRLGDYVAVFKNQHEIRAIGVVSGDYRHEEKYGSDYPHVRPVEWLDLEDHDIHELNGGFGMTRPTVYPLDKIPLQDFITLLPEEENQGEKPYVLIIDEINRGNISRIFGELITLLEPDKRRGANNELSTRLPYSGENFSVPRNLHIIGTMNTADRSIALLDVALRRRFEFEEMMPDAAVLEEHGISETVRSVFEVLNARITALLDRDHQIGHSYFLGATSPEELHHALYRRVFPLLQEYFYNDPAQLRRLLGAYESSENTGFIDADDLKLGKGFSLDTGVDDSPWKFHPYTAGELEGALRNTFLEE